MTMLRSLRDRLGARTVNGSIDHLERLRAEIDELTWIDADDPSAERERQILRLRHRLGAALVSGPGRSPQDRSRPFPGLDRSGLAAVEPEGLDGALLRGGIEAHGHVLVRGMVGRDDALALAERVEDAFRARESQGPDEEGTGDGLYEEFRPDPPYRAVPGRKWISAGGGVLAADSPAVMTAVLATFERVGLRRVIGEYLDEPATIAVQKCTLRRADPAPAGGWHQDGSFMGETRPLNVWLSLSDCGIESPGLDFVNRRIDELLATGSAGSGAEHLEAPNDDDGKVSAKNVLISPHTVELVAGDGGVVRPRFEPGDVMLFDDRFLHRTGSDPEMPNPRYAIESWFFGASGFPVDYVPLAF